MGLFNFFRKKTSYDEKLSAAYLCFNKNLVNSIFPDGIKQADIVLVSLAKILNIDLSKRNALDYFNFLTIYSDVVIRSAISSSSADRIIQYLLDKYEKIITSQNLAQKVYSYCLLNIANSKFIFNTVESDEAVSQLANTQLDSESKRNLIFKHRRADQDDFGYSENNPICTSSIRRSEEYLSKLMTQFGDQLFWLRIGSKCLPKLNDVENIILDIYQIYLYGEEYTTLYICPYARDSADTPKGLKLNSREFLDSDLLKDAKEKDSSVEALLKIKKMEHENELLRKEREIQAKIIEQQRYAEYSKVANSIKKEFPSFDLDQELKNSLFNSLAQAGVALRTVYLYIHKEDLLSEKRYNTTHSILYDEEEIYDKILKIEEQKRQPLKDETRSELAQKAKDYGITLQQMLEIKAMELENAGIRWEREKKKIQSTAKEVVALKKVYPFFDYFSAIENSTFNNLKHLGLQIAFEIAFFDDLFEKNDSDSSVCSLKAPTDKPIVSPVDRLAEHTITLIDQIKTQNEESFLVKNTITCCDTILFACFVVRAWVIGSTQNRNLAIDFSDNYIKAIMRGVLSKYEDSRSYFPQMFDNRMLFFDKMYASKNAIEEKFKVLVDEFEHIIKTDIFNQAYSDFSETNPWPVLGLNKDFMCKAEVLAFFQNLPNMLEPDLSAVLNSL